MDAEESLIFLLYEFSQINKFSYVTSTYIF